MARLPVYIHGLTVNEKTLYDALESDEEDRSSIYCNASPYGLCNKFNSQLVFLPYNNNVKDSLIFCDGDPSYEEFCYMRSNNNRIILNHSYEGFIKTNVTHNDLSLAINPELFWKPELLRGLGETKLEGVFHFYTTRWWWMLEYCTHKLNHIDQIYSISDNKIFKGLLPLRNIRPHKTIAWKKFESIKDDLMWSYNQYLGVFLPGDSYCPSGQSYDRYVNPQWYDQTYCSIVVESYIESSFKHLISEKTWKPIIFGHPFMILGQAGLIKKLRHYGFATYDNLFDESYDNIGYSRFDSPRRIASDNFDKDIESFKQRLDKVFDNINEISELCHDNETIKRIKHNHNHFFNVKNIKHIVNNDIINPILEYAETR